MSRPPCGKNGDPQYEREDGGQGRGGPRWQRALDGTGGACCRGGMSPQRGAAAFRSLLTAAIERHHGFACPAQMVLGDGAGWLGRLRDEVLPEAPPVLDRWHLCQARRRALRAAIPDKEARTPWHERLEDLLDVGDLPRALTTLTEVAPHPALEEFVG